VDILSGEWPWWLSGLFLVALFVVLTTLGKISMLIWPPHRATPDGYVGRFRRPGGDEVHVARVNGRLMLISQEPPGVEPRDLGDVDGREMMTWQRLGTRPDG
jgi:hypothetical protein